jgi:hypothetical protein
LESIDFEKAAKRVRLGCRNRSAIAVVVSLIYVGISVNKNTGAILVANHQALVAMDQDTNAWCRDSEFAEIVETAEDDVSKLSPVQARQ